MLALSLCLPAPAAAQKTVIASIDGGAFVTSDGRNLWSIGNDRVALSLGLNARGALALTKLSRPEAEESWSLEPVGDFSVVANGQHLVPGEGDFRYRSFSTAAADGAVLLSIVFESPSARLQAIRTWACYPEAPAIESWTRFTPIAAPKPITLAEISVLELGAAGSSVNWITGLHPADALPPFTRQRRSASEGLDIRARQRSTTEYLPVIWLDGAPGHVVAGLLWSGSWAIGTSAAEEGGRTSIRASLGSTETALAPGTSFESPHAFVAVAPEGQVSAALASYISVGLRKGRPFTPLVTFNTWFADGVRLEESELYSQMAHAFELGTELFVLDAGWYAGGGDAFDFTTGIGRWVPDPARFPIGLRPISDAVHSYGMRFGIWMEPERIDLATLSREPDPDTGEPTPPAEHELQESWLATAGGSYEPGVESPVAAQICLAHPQARQWVIEQVSRVIEETGADYLKWDNNFWIDCDREGHGHGPLDGNLAHHLGLYEVLRQLRERFPSLIVENCAQGGNRLDLGMMRYTDTAWMDDVTSPSAHVRHNLQGLGAVYPPSYLLSFLTNDPAEPIFGAWDLPAYLRSRMPGILGLSLRPEEMGEWDLQTMIAEVARYKAFRDASIGAPLMLLTSQADLPETDGWDGMQVPIPGTGDSVLYIFARPGATDSSVIRLRALDPEASYRVSWSHGEPIGEAAGAYLMADGIGVSLRAESSATVLMITRQIPIPEDAARRK